VEVLALLPIRWRLLIAGCMVSAISAALLIAKGPHAFYLVLLAIGVALLVVSLVWLSRTRRG
jgi:hypothetical protein